MTYPYKQIQKPKNEKYLQIASVKDIGCMKLSAILGRASNKDYIDLYYMLQKISLKDVLQYATKKFPNFNINLALKSLVYYEDIIDESIRFLEGKEVSQEQIQSFLKELVKTYCKSVKQ